MKKKILILDDDEGLKTIIGKILKINGYEYEKASNVSEAISVIDKDRFDIVLCDINLDSNETGLDFLSYCVENHKDAGFIMVSGVSDQETIKKAIELGIYGYLVKPFDNNQLLITIDNSIKRLELEIISKIHLEALDGLVKDRTVKLSKNIRELQDTKKQLQESEETFRSIFENMQEGFYRTDMEGRIVMSNPAANKITGYKNDELIGIKITDLYNNPEHREIILEELLKKGHLSNIETVIKRKDGTLINILAASHVIYDINRNPMGIEGIFHDISKKVALEAQISESRRLRAIGKLASGIAHEINTPTQYVGDNTLFLQDSFNDIIDLLKEFKEFLNRSESIDKLQPSVLQARKSFEEKDLEYLIEEIPKAIKQSLSGIERVAEIVKSMKKFAHPSKEKVTVDINTSIKDTLTVSKSEWKYVSDIELDFDENLPEILCFPGELNQVFLNIIVNASHSIADVVGETGTKGLIKIHTRKMGKDIEIRISDSGKGIPEENKMNIFEPFYTTKGIGKGTGQGLAIARSVIVEKHSGKLWFESEMGNGTTFFIVLPQF